MKIKRGAIAFFSAVLFSSTLAAADFGVRVGRFNDIEENFVGAEVVFDLGAISFNPNVEYILEDDVDAFTVNADFTYSFRRGSTISPWVGLGVGLFSARGDEEEANEGLANAIAGIGWKAGTLTPYAQIKYFRLFEDSRADDVALTVGLRF